jgi:hypothetical protein
MQPSAPGSTRILGVEFATVPPPLATSMAAVGGLARNRRVAASCLTVNTNALPSLIVAARRAVAVFSDEECDPA